MKISDDNIEILCYRAGEKIKGKKYLSLVRHYIELLRSKYIKQLPLSIVTDTGFDSISDDLSDLDEKVVKYLPADWAYYKIPNEGDVEYSDESYPRVCFSSTLIVCDRIGGEELSVVSFSFGSDELDDYIIIKSIKEFYTNMDIAESLRKDTVNFMNATRSILRKHGDRKIELTASS